MLDLPNNNNNIERIVMIVLSPKASQNMSDEMRRKC